MYWCREACEKEKKLPSKFQQQKPVLNHSVLLGIHKQKANQSSKHFAGQLSCRDRTASIQYAQKQSVFVQRQFQPSWRGNAAVFTVGIVTMESCELPQNVCEVMDGNYDSVLPLLGQGQIAIATGDTVPGPAGFPLKSILLSGGSGPGPCMQWWSSTLMVFVIPLFKLWISCAAVMCCWG